MANILEIIKKDLEPGDNIRHQYRTIYNRSEGFLALSDRKLVFTEPKGFFRPSYQTTLNIPYPKINKIVTTASHALELEAEGKTYTITSVDVTANIIVKEIKELKEQITSSQ